MMIEHQLDRWRILLKRENNSYIASYIIQVFTFFWNYLKILWHIWSRNPTARHISRENHNPKRYTHPTFFCSTTHNSQDKRTTSMSIDRWMDEDRVRWVAPPGAVQSSELTEQGLPLRVLQSPGLAWVLLTSTSQVVSCPKGTDWHLVYTQTHLSHCLCENSLTF